MFYLVRGDVGNEVPLNRFGFMVDDQIASGEYGHQYGSVPTLEEALDAIDSAIDTKQWRYLPYCLNNYANPSFPILYEFAFPVAEDNTNTTPLAHAHSSNGSETNQALLNGVTFQNIVTSWDEYGSATIAGGSPCETSTRFELAASGAVVFRWGWVVLPSECLQDGKFSFAEGQKWTYYTVGLSYHRDAVLNKWEWHAGQYTGHFDIPAAWYELNDTEPEPGETDPYVDPTGGGESEPGGGDEDQDNWDDDSDPNPVPPLPTVEATDAGFIELYAPSISQLKTLANYMWSSSFDLDTFKKLFADPMDCILGLSIVPVNVQGSASTVNVGNISTGVSMYKATSQYASVDCGTVTVSEKLHSYLDYAPYRKASIYLPYIGTKEIDIDILNGSSVGVVYHVDVLTGGLVAYITVNGNVIAHYNGQCAINVPISGRDLSSTISTICTLVSGAAGTVASGGLTAPVSAASVAGLVSAGASTANNVMNAKPTIQIGGSIGSSTGILAIQKPYLIIERPNLCRPANQNLYTGYPSYVTTNLGSITGFTQVQDIRLNNFTMTDSERNELLNLLRSGVIL